MSHFNFSILVSFLWIFSQSPLFYFISISLSPGHDREIYAFGQWNYPETDVLQVVVTNQSGQKKLACEHKSGDLGSSNCATRVAKST